MAPNAALYSNSGSYYGNSDRLLRVVTLRGKPSVDATNTTLTFNVTVAPSSSEEDTVTVYRVSFNTTANGTDTPQVSEQEYGTVRSTLFLRHTSVPSAHVHGSVGHKSCLRLCICLKFASRSLSVMA